MDGMEVPQHTHPALGWELGRAGVFGCGGQANPQERYNTGSVWGRVLSNKAQMTCTVARAN